MPEIKEIEPVTLFDTIKKNKTVLWIVLGVVAISVIAIVIILKQKKNN